MGHHLMFFGINKKLGEGELMNANFKFKNSRDLLVKFKVESNKSSHNHEHWKLYLKKRGWIYPLFLEML